MKQAVDLLTISKAIEFSIQNGSNAEHQELLNSITKHGEKAVDFTLRLIQMDIEMEIVLALVESIFTIGVTETLGSEKIRKQMLAHRYSRDIYNLIMTDFILTGFANH